LTAIHNGLALDSKQPSHGGDIIRREQIATRMPWAFASPSLPVFLMMLRMRFRMRMRLGSLCVLLNRRLCGMGPFLVCRRRIDRP
jgi:hypothetical protein